MLCRITFRLAQHVKRGLVKAPGSGDSPDSVHRQYSCENRAGQGVRSNMSNHVKTGNPQGVGRFIREIVEMMARRCAVDEWARAWFEFGLGQPRIPRRLSQ